MWIQLSYLNDILIIIATFVASQSNFAVARGSQVTVYQKWMMQQTHTLITIVCLLIFVTHSKIKLPKLNRNVIETEQLEQKVAALSAAREYESIIKVTTATFLKYVRQRPRNYSVVAVTTSLDPQMGCQVCLEVYEQFKLLFDSYKRNNKDHYSANKLFFIVIAERSQIRSVREWNWLKKSLIFS